MFVTFFFPEKEEDLSYLKEKISKTKVITLPCNEMIETIDDSKHRAFVQHTKTVDEKHLVVITV